MSFITPHYWQTFLSGYHIQIRVLWGMENVRVMKVLNLMTHKLICQKNIYKRAINSLQRFFSSGTKVAVLIYTRALVLSTPSPGSQEIPSPGSFSQLPTCRSSSQRHQICIVSALTANFLAFCRFITGAMQVQVSSSTYVGVQEAHVEVWFQGIPLSALPLKCQIAQPNSESYRQPPPL